MYTYKILEVCKVVDGDTVDVLLDLGFSITLKQRIRLAEVDAPELTSKDAKERQLGIQAKDYVSGWIKSSQSPLLIRTTKDDKYGRMLGHIYNEQSELNRSLVDMGYVWPYDGETKSKDLTKLSGWSSISNQ